MGHMSTCGQFCDTLVNATSGLVKRGSDTGKKGGATSSAKKRPNPQDNGEPPKRNPRKVRLHMMQLKMKLLIVSLVSVLS